MTSTLRVITLALLALAAPALSGDEGGATPARGLPPLMLWAWERPTDLRALPADAGVAFLAQTISIDSARWAVSPRRQTLKVSSHTPLIAVTRLEAPVGDPIALGEAQLRRIARTIVATTTWPRVIGVQVDFDATQSQRETYRTLLHLVRAELPPKVALSMTALASWCMSDDWLEGLPVDEAVPMLFRLGEGEARIDRRALTSLLRAPACHGAAGVSLDEDRGGPPREGRTYVFNADAWTPAHVAEARRRAGR